MAVSLFFYLLAGPYIHSSAKYETVVSNICFANVRNSKVAVPTFAVENNHTVSDTGSEALGNSDIAIVTFACAE